MGERERDKEWEGGGRRRGREREKGLPWLEGCQHGDVLCVQEEFESSVMEVGL